jgi:hypothetical protein
MIWQSQLGSSKVLRAIAFMVSAAFLACAAASPCFADDQGTKPQATKPAPKKQDMKTRSLQKPSVQAAPGAVPPPPSSSGDGGSAEDTLGGLPGHSHGSGAERP